jgi:hypothetical protein
MRPELSRRLSEVVECRNIVEWTEIQGSNIARLGFNGEFVRFTPNLLASVGVDRILNSNSKSSEARVERVGGEVRVYLRQDLDELDSRALLAHEIGHVLLARHKELFSVIRQQKLDQDPDVEELVDWIAQSLLVPRESINCEEPTILFEAGFSLASKWRVRPRLAFTRLLKFAGRRGDICFSFSTQSPGASQMALFDEPVPCRLNWVLAADELSFLGNENIVVRKVRGASPFLLDRQTFNLIEGAVQQYDNVASFARNVTFRRLFKGKSVIRAISRDGLRKPPNERDLSSFVIWCS